MPGLTSQAATLLNQKGLPRVATLLQGFSGSLRERGPGIRAHPGTQDHHRPPDGERVGAGQRMAHEQIVAALSGRTTSNSAVAVANGQVTLDLAPFIQIAKQDLASRGLTIVNSIPIVHVTFALFPSKDLVKAQTAYRLINDLKWVLPILTLVLLGLGIYIAKGHRRATIGAGLGFAASMLVLGAGLLIARSMYLNAVPNSTLPGDAAAAAFDTLVRFIRIGLRTLLVVGLVVAIGAFITGPSVTAGGVRSGFARAFGWIRGRGEVRWRQHRPRRQVDLRAPQGAAHLGGRARRPDLRFLRAHDSRRGRGDRRAAACRPRPHRTDRQAAGGATHPARPHPPSRGTHYGTGSSASAGAMARSQAMS